MGETLSTVESGRRTRSDLAECLTTAHSEKQGHAGLMTSFLDEVLFELTSARGIDLSGYRRSMIERRLASRLAVPRISEPGQYRERLRTCPDEHDRLIETISINVTSFFRNPVVWEILAQSVIRSVLEEKFKSRSREFRIWSAGCASGEEPYSIAILLHEILRRELAQWKVHIFATDLSEEALRVATQAVYPRERMENTRLGILDRYFTCEDGQYKLRPFVRRMVWFSRDDLTSTRAAPAESIYGTFDLVLMDVQLPVLSGMDAVRQIKSDRRLARIPIVALTAKVMRGDRERILSAGCDDYLPKPLDRSELLRILNKWAS